MSRPKSEPGYWRNESTGRLKPVVEKYLHNKPLTSEEVATMRAYLRQWVTSTVWDLNPFDHGEGVSKLRAQVDGLVSEESLRAWLKNAFDMGIDPL